jgi:hypothetical protein
VWDPARLGIRGLLGGVGFGLQEASAARCDDAWLRQPIAAERRYEVGGKLGVSFKGGVKLGAALELAKEFKQRTFAEGMNAFCQKGEAFGWKVRKGGHGRVASSRRLASPCASGYLGLVTSEIFLRPLAFAGGRFV